MRFNALPTACLALLFGSLSQAQPTGDSQAQPAGNSSSINSLFGGKKAGTGAAQAKITCPTGDGVGLIAVRGSTEDPGPGRMLAPVVTNATNQMPGTTLVSVDYPARLIPDYVGSEREGVVALTALMRQYATACPGAPMVLMGYSQGAQVIADVISNATTPVDNPAQPLSLNDVAGVLMFGDPSRVDGEPFNAGSANGDGLFARVDSKALEALGDRLLSICNDGDPVCDRGINLSVHLSYDETNGAQGSQFVVNRGMKAVAAKKAAAKASPPEAKGKRAAAWTA
ncbi:carbohydrate esterase family 5 protein [Apiospora arundinis]|uniref:Acetyl xylanesterase n=1 Tax=Apiospora arundinis TaxID=335852 RepID=A0ABR2J6X9_9PEZI